MILRVGSTEDTEIDLTERKVILDPIAIHPRWALIFTDCVFLHSLDSRISDIWKFGITLDQWMARKFTHFNDKLFNVDG